MVKFVIPGIPDIRGYYAEGRYPNWRRKKSYEQWKDHVRAVAFAEGVEIPLEATKDSPVYVVTHSFFGRGIHPDPENVHKGVVDALVWVSPEERKLGRKRGSDRYTGGIFFAPHYDKECPRAEVTLCTEQEFNRVCIDHFIATMDRVIDDIRT